MYHEIRQAGVKGLGVFATRHIPRGTRVLAEQPLLLVKQERDVYQATKLLTTRDKEGLQQLSVSPIRRSSLLSWTEAAWHAISSTRPRDILGAGPNQSRPGWPSWSGIAEHLSILDIFRNNNFDIGDGRQAVFRDISRLNHACVPNAQGNFNSGLGRFTIHTTQPIRTGDEITISYLGEHAALRAARQERLQSGYGFLCACPACDATGTEGQRSEERRLMVRHKLHEYAEGAAGQEVPDAAAELAMTETLIDVYEGERLHGRELATMYLAAGELSARLNDRDRALGHAKKGLDMERDVLGEDNPQYRQSVERMRHARLDGRRDDG